MPVNPSATSPEFCADLAVHDEAYRCVYSNDDFPAHSLAAFTHELTLSGRMLICTSFLASVYGTLAQNVSPRFSYTLYTSHTKFIKDK
jgi:hypothetical protein